MWKMRLLRKEIDVITSSIFISFLLFLIIYSLSHIGVYSFMPAIVLSVLIVLFVLVFVYLKHGIITFLLSSAILIISLCFTNVSSVFTLSLLFLTSPFYYYELRGKSLSDTVAEFHLGQIDWQDIMYGILLVLLVLFITYILSLIMKDAGLNDSQKVYDKLVMIPKPLLLIVIILGSISEEIFFRAFMVREVGPFVSAVLFAAAHGFYGSISEMLVVLPIGFIFSYFYFYKKRIYPTIIAHLCFNILMFVVFLVAY